jgi:hypothetical protein
MAVGAGAFASRHHKYGVGEVIVYWVLVGVIKGGPVQTAGSGVKME